MDEVKKNVKKIEITPALKEKVAVLARENDIAMVLLFGSQSTGDVHEESDVDVAYQLGRVLSAQEEIALNASFAEVFQNDHVDTVNLTHASPLLAHEILKQAVVLYDRTGMAFPSFELHTLRSFAEARPLFETRREKLHSLVYA